MPPPTAAGQEGGAECFELARDIRAASPGADVSRNPSSRQRGAGKQAGDLRVLLPNGEPWGWCLEAKHTEQIHALHLWEPSAALLEAWEQCRRQAAAANERPLLVFKTTRGPVLAVVRVLDAVCPVRRDGKPIQWLNLGGDGVEVAPWDAWLAAAAALTVRAA